MAFWKCRHDRDTLPGQIWIRVDPTQPHIMACADPDNADAMVTWRNEQVRQFRQAFEVQTHARVEKMEQRLLVKVSKAFFELDNLLQRMKWAF
jgi:hypothetical protein